MKLVRDRIPQIIIESGQTPRCHVADLPEFTTRLYEKMKEELGEFIENPCVEEAADMYEVLRSICWMHKISMEEVSEAAASKNISRGAFTCGYVLEGVESEETDDDWTVTAYGEQKE